MIPVVVALSALLFGFGAADRWLAAVPTAGADAEGHRVLVGAVSAMAACAVLLALG